MGRIRMARWWETGQEEENEKQVLWAKEYFKHYIESNGKPLEHDTKENGLIRLKILNFVLAAKHRSKA